MRCQKTKFILSKKVIYLNCAYMSPMLKKVEKIVNQQKENFHRLPQQIQKDQENQNMMTKM